jgi:hypothetical protein
MRILTNETHTSWNDREMIREMIQNMQHVDPEFGDYDAFDLLPGQYQDALRQNDDPLDFYVAFTTDSTGTLYLLCHIDIEFVTWEVKDFFPKRLNLLNVKAVREQLENEEREARTKWGPILNGTSITYQVFDCNSGRLSVYKTDDLAPMDNKPYKLESRQGFPIRFLTAIEAQQWLDTGFLQQ